MPNKYVVEISPEFGAPAAYEAKLIDVKIINDQYDIQFTLKLLPLQECGQSRFHILHYPTKSYTIIGAENIHHASNKASKLFKDKWSGITKEPPIGSWWVYLSIPNFNAAINKGG